MKPIPNIDFDKSKIRLAKQLLRALDHKLRQRIILSIDECGSINNNDLFIKLRIEQSVLSQHLAILRRAKVINVNPEGKYRYYSISDKLHYFNNKISEITK